MTDQELKETYKNKWIKTEWRLLDNTLMETIYFYVLDVNKYEEPGDYYVFNGHRYLTPERDNKFCPIYAKYDNIAVTIDSIMIVDETEVIQRLSDDKAKFNTYMEKITDDILMTDIMYPCDLKNSDYECLFFKKSDGCRGICAENGKPCCEYCKLKEK